MGTKIFFLILINKFLLCKSLENSFLDHKKLQINGVAFDFFL